MGHNKWCGDACRALRLRRRVPSPSPAQKWPLPQSTRRYRARKAVRGCNSSGRPPFLELPSVWFGSPSTATGFVSRALDEACAIDDPVVPLAVPDAHRDGSYAGSINQGRRRETRSSLERVGRWIRAAVLRVSAEHPGTPHHRPAGRIPDRLFGLDQSAQVQPEAASRLRLHRSLQLSANPRVGRVLVRALDHARVHRPCRRHRGGARARDRTPAQS